MIDIPITIRLIKYILYDFFFPPLYLHFIVCGLFDRDLEPAINAKEVLKAPIFLYLVQESIYNIKIC